jgi:Na+/melibiose symporter-like transporter
MGKTSALDFFAAFLTDYAKIPVAMAGIVLMVTSIFDIIWVPTAGVILEKSSIRWKACFQKH